MYYLFNPPTGANNLVIAQANGSDNYLLAVSANYSGTSGSLDGTVETYVSDVAETSQSAPSGSLSNANSWVISGCGPGTTNSLTNTVLTKVVDGAAFTLGFIFDTNGVAGGTGALANTYNFSSITFAAIVMAVSPAASAASGSLAVTMPDLTLAGTATVPVGATLASTIAAFTLSGTATVPIGATLATTMPAFTLAGTATIPVGATLAVTMPNFTLAGTGTVITAATLAKTIADLTLAGTATVSGGVVSGSLAATMPAFTLVGTAGVISAGSLAVTIPAFTLVGTAQVLSIVTAALSATSPAFILSATATVGVAPAPPTPPGVTAFIMQGLILGTTLTDEPIAAGQYKVSVSARWNYKSQILIGTVGGSQNAWSSNGTRGIYFPLGQLVVTVINATSVKIVISPS
jgi:hypothetical protein